MPGLNVVCEDLEDLNSETTLWSDSPQEARDYSGCNFDGVSWAGKDLTHVNLSGAGFAGANLEGALLGYSNFHEANLSGANLKNADLRSAAFTGANLTNADLSGAILHTAYEDGDGAFTFADTFFPNADLTGAIFTGFLSEHNRFGADFSHAIIR